VERGTTHSHYSHDEESYQVFALSTRVIRAGPARPCVSRCFSNAANGYVDHSHSIDAIIGDIGHAVKRGWVRGSPSVRISITAIGMKGTKGLISEMFSSVRDRKH
jgi:hypothetical protein